MTSNNALVPDPDKFDVLASAPFDWPFQHLGLRMCGWGDQQLKYYLIGTPLIWQGSTISLFIAVLLLGFYLFRQQRKYVDMEPRAAFHAPGVVIDSTKRFICRRMGPFPLRREDRVLWVVLPFR